MRPSVFLLWLITAWCALALLIALFNTFAQPPGFLTPLWVMSGAVLLIIAGVDVLRGGPSEKLDVVRTLPHSLALGAATQVSLALTNQLQRRLHITLAEPPCNKIDHHDFSIKADLNPLEKKQFGYSILPIKRGDARLTQIAIRIDTPWRLWQHCVRAGNENEIKIYPNFSPISQMAQLGVEQHIRRLGVHLVQRRGDGMEFKQLRDFVEGDALRQIDWKVTARYNKPISREYQDERNQEVFFLLDCGRRLRHEDSGLSHFDYALNALLLTSYIALRQGDSVGFTSFAGDKRWLAPVSGQVGTHRLLEKLYDLNCTKENSDYLAAAQAFLKRQRRRSLVILVTNLRTEDIDDIVCATRLMAKQHIVMVASLKENVLDDNINKPVTSFSDALNYTASHILLSERQAIAKKLTAQGVLFVDTPPEMLSLNLVSEYIKVKRSGRL